MLRVLPALAGMTLGLAAQAGAGCISLPDIVEFGPVDFNKALLYDVSDGYVRTVDRRSLGLVTFDDQCELRDSSIRLELEPGNQVCDYADVNPFHFACDVSLVYPFD